MAAASSTKAVAEAEAFKVKGNEKYKADQLDEAIKLYKKATALQPEEPVGALVHIP